MKNLIIQLRTKSAKFIFKVLYMIKPVYAADFMYYHAFHKHLDLGNPQDLIEKIYWLLYNTDTTMWTLCADKYRMREYVERCGFKDHLPKLYGHWGNPEEIDFDILPNEFVLKANNGCGTVKIVRDKLSLDKAATIKMLKTWLKPFGYIAGQTHYMHIQPCIIAEELLHQDGELNSISSKSLVDYKVWCFHGKPECILVIHDREGRGYLMDMYDTKWERIPNSLKHNAHYGANDMKINKPVCLEQILQMANKLAEPFIELRVDFYVIADKPVVGELTFTSGYGNYTDEFYKYLGSKIDLSKVKRIDEENPSNN